VGAICRIYSRQCNVIFNGNNRITVVVVIVIVIVIAAVITIENLLRESRDRGINFVLCG